MWNFFAESAKKNKKMTSLYFFSKKNLCPQTNFWTGKMMLMPFLTKAVLSKSDMLKLHKKWMETYWKDFDTVLRQLWENWLNPFVWSAKTPRTKLWRNYLTFFFKRVLTPTFCSRKEKWKLRNASPKKTAESLETFCLKSK